MDESTPDGEDPSSPRGTDAEESWRFSLDDVDEDGIVQSSIEPGDPELENVVFVALGVLATVLLVVRLLLLL